DENQHKRTVGKPHHYGKPRSSLHRGWRESPTVLQKCSVAWRWGACSSQDAPLHHKKRDTEARAKIGLTRSLPNSHQAFDAEEDPRRRVPYPATPAKPARG